MLFFLLLGARVQAAGVAPVDRVPAGASGGAGAGGDRAQAQPPRHRAQPPPQGEEDPGAGGQPGGGEAAPEQLRFQVQYRLAQVAACAFRTDMQRWFQMSALINPGTFQIWAVLRPTEGRGRQPEGGDGEPEGRADPTQGGPWGQGGQLHPHGGLSSKWGKHLLTVLRTDHEAKEVNFTHTEASLLSEISTVDHRTHHEAKEVNLTNTEASLRRGVFNTFDALNFVSFGYIHLSMIKCTYDKVKDKKFIFIQDNTVAI